MRESVGRAEAGIKAGGPDRLEQEAEEKKKYLIGIKCPDRVCVGDWIPQSALALFSDSPEKWECMREGKGGENNN